MGLSLKQWRLAKEISQEKMATACGVHRNTYAAWEENPDDISIGNAKIIARALHESVDTIFLATILQNVVQVKIRKNRKSKRGGEKNEQTKRCKRG